MLKINNGLVFLIAFSCQTAVAAIPDLSSSQKLLGDLYVAANVGILHGTFNNMYNDQTDVIEQNIAETVAQNGYEGGIAIGYIFPLKTIYSIGIEASGNVATDYARFKSGASTAAFSDKTYINSFFDFVIIPGVAFTETVTAYAKIGASFARIQDKLVSPVGFTPTYQSYHSSDTALVKTFAEWL